jgi:hypothetical protein
MVDSADSADVVIVDGVRTIARQPVCARPTAAGNLGGTSPS